MKLLNVTMGALIVMWAWLGVEDAAVGEAAADRAVVSVRSVLPSTDQAKRLLNTTTRHREWLRVPVSASTSILAWVVYPEVSERAPLVMIKGESPAVSDWTRAVSDQLAAEGYLAVVPDVLTEVDTEGNQRAAAATQAIHPTEIDHRMRAVQAVALEIPSANGVIATVSLAPGRHMLDAQVATNVASFELSSDSWPRFVDYLNTATSNRPTFIAHEHAGHISMLQAAQAPGGRAGRGGGLFAKDPRLPAGYFTARSTLLNSKLRSEWVDIPLEGSPVKLHTFIVYPEGTAPAGVVIVMQHGVGLDEWQRALADQVAQDGFIAVAPDLWSGTGPNGGNWDASEFIDDAIRAAAGKITPEETTRRYRVAREYGLKLPRANGKTGSIGFCAGGGNSFRFAGEVPEHNAAVVFYGTAPSEDVMRRITSPVLGFYGENDARVTATVEPTREAMARLGKQFEAHIYPKATHSFVLFQDIGNNPAAIADAWPRTVAFFRRYLM